MAADFNVQFIINDKTQTYVIRLTDASSGYTLTKGLFSITFPDGSTRIKTDFNNPDITSPLGYVDVLAVTNSAGVLTGQYKIDFVGMDGSSNTYSSSKTFDFNFKVPSNGLTDRSDSTIPQVEFYDSASYSPNGSFTGSVSRTFKTTMPSTSEVANDILTSSTNTLDVFDFGYYEGVYSVTNEVSATYTHSSNSWLTVLFTGYYTATFDVRQAPSQSQLIEKINTYRSYIDALKGKNDSQFELLSEQYDLVVSLYSHLISRVSLGYADGSQSILTELLSIVEPYNNHTYQSTPMTAFTFDSFMGINALYPLSYNPTTRNLSIPYASGVSDGYLTASDWITFNNKQDIIQNNIIGQGSAGYVPVFTSSNELYINSLRDTGTVSIGGDTYPNISLNVAKNIQNYPFAYGVSQNGIVQTSVLSSAYGFYNEMNIVATGTSYSLFNYSHYYAQVGQIGSNSSVTNQYGFYSNITGSASNNYSFYSNLNAGSNSNWGLYLAGDANSYINGNLGIGTNLYLNYINVAIVKKITGATSAISLYLENEVQSDVTTSAFVVYTQPKTIAANFTLGALYHFTTGQGTIGAGSTIGTQIGFYASSQLTGATNNYGFYGQIASATGRWNLYMAGSASNYMAGSLGIGTTSLTGTSLYVGKNLTGGTSSFGIRQSGTVLSDVTGFAYGFLNQAYTQASAFTLGQYRHFMADQPNAFGSGSTVTNQYGFFAESSLTGATNNYGFFGNIASGTNRWNLYMVGTANNYMAGNLGIGSTNLGSTSLRVSKSITGGTIAYGILSDGQIQSDVTSQAYAYLSTITTQATAFTLSGLYHFRAIQGTIGAGSTITNQYGIFIGSELVGATNNYAYYGGIPSATNNWNLYMAGTAPNYMAGALGIGTTGVGSVNLYVSKNITGNATNSYSIYSVGTVQSDVTGNAFMYRSLPSTAAAAFTLGTIHHYNATQGTIGAGSTVSIQYGFVADATLIGATTNYGFFGGIASGAGRWNIYMSGTASNYLAGSLGIATTTLTGRLLALGGSITGGTTSYSVVSTAGVLSDVTDARIFASFLNTQATTFTLTNASHFFATQSSIGAGSTITNQYGYFADSTITGATNNYGFYGAISAGTGRWNMYMAGSASNYLGGSLGIGTTSLAGMNLRSSKSITGSTTSYAIIQDGQVQSDVTAIAHGYYNGFGTVAATFTLSNYMHFRAVQGGLGAGSTVTNQFGFYVDSSLIGATNDYGFYGNLAAGTNIWNLYMNGTANNYMAGRLGIGSTTLTDVNLRVSNNITGGTNNKGLMVDGAIQSDSTSSASVFVSQVSVQATAFTLPVLAHFNVNLGSPITTATVTNQYGVIVQSSMTGATNNYAFYSNLASATGVWNLYMNGTANNYMAGGLGIGSTTVGNGINLNVAKTMTGATTQWNIYNQSQVQSDVTLAVDYFRTNSSTQAATFTLPNLIHYRAFQGTFGAGSTVTNQYGFYIDATLSGATNNYGYYSNIASAATNWNLYLVGTAKNYIAGNLLIGTTTDNGYKLDVNGSSRFTAISVTTGYYDIQPTPTALTATATLTIAQIQGDIITVTSSTAVTLTLPTGTLTDAGVLGGALQTNGCFDWYIINLGSTSGAVTMAAGTGHTYVGNATIAINSSAQFRTVKTAANTFVTYRVN